MHIRKISIKNFRLLNDIELSLEERTTVIVGRNNSGKTSLAELFRRLLSENSPTFGLEDFSLGIHNKFWSAYNSYNTKGNEDKYIDNLPAIEIILTIDYKKSVIQLGLLSDFIVDLDPDCTEVQIKILYQLDGGKINRFFEGIQLESTSSENEQKSLFFKAIKERITKFYKPNLYAVDPNDFTNQKHIELKKLQSLLQSGFINAQRELDDTSYKEKDILGKILESLFNTAMSDSADPNDRSIVQKLEAAVQTIQVGINDNFNEQLTNLLPTFELFGYPGLRDPKLLTETMLNVDLLLKNHTKIRYSGVNGVHLPEAYNGLGARNLIYILLKLLEFFKVFKTRSHLPGVHLIFIEEPEAHLHPQMQEVFISKLNDIANMFSKEFNDGNLWPVQFIVTTHSSHMANKASFGSLRYFLATPNKGADNYSTKIKDLREGVSGPLEKDVEFLQQYMTLTRCDLLFADKVIMIEGTTERILLPKMIEKLEKTQPDLKLSSQYISVLEVGGAYAHKFFKLINFLELRTLIITDIDTINSDDGGKACKVSEGNGTSNACIKAWFKDEKVSPIDLIQKSDKEKINSISRIAYQVPEILKMTKPCGRSFEDAFILKNMNYFDFTIDSPEKDEENAWTKSKNLKKSKFALEFAIEKTEWNVPRYISEGLIWLAENKQQPTIELLIASDIMEVLAEVASAQEETHE
jgi:predicted ATP-dependent endonuclease of OLD family